jgi:hypothetical protein
MVACPRPVTAGLRRAVPYTICRAEPPIVPQAPGSPFRKEHE